MDTRFKSISLGWLAISRLSSLDCWSLRCFWVLAVLVYGEEERRNVQGTGRFVVAVRSCIVCIADCIMFGVVWAGYLEMGCWSELVRKEFGWKFGPTFVQDGGNKGLRIELK